MKGKKKNDDEGIIMPDSKKNKKLHHGSRTTMWVLLSVAVLIILGMVTIAPYMMTKSEKDVTFYIPEGASMEQVVDTLNKYYPESYSNRVVHMLKLYGFDPVARHGMYKIPAGASPFATGKKLARGGQEQVEIRFNGFRTLQYLADRLALKMEFTADEFLEAATDSAYLAKYGLTPSNALALFLDDTYYVYWSSSPREVLDKIGSNYITFWNEGRRDVALANQLTPAEVMILASIVDDETNQIQEKGRIGHLYINRLDKDMPLQADPTVKFALNDFSLRRILEEHTRVESPYNTYKYKGLPPGPLRTTSRATVSEILNYDTPNTDLYMCARPDGSGFHNFASTYEDHLKNAKAYHDYLNEKGVK